MSRRSRRHRRQVKAQSSAPARVDAVPQRVEHGDGWNNLFTLVGDTSRDKRTGSSFGSAPIVSEPELDALFQGNDLAKRICTLPAQEATRAWFKLKIDDAKDDGSEDKSDTAPRFVRLDVEDEQAARQDTCKELMQQLQTLKARAKVAEALTWARLYGGAVIYVGADMGTSDDPKLPLDPTRVQAVRHLTVFHRHEVRIAELDGDPLSETFGEPLFYEPITFAGGRVSYGRKIHASRILHFDGTLTSRKRRILNQGWADSVFVALYEVLRGYGATWDSAEALMQDFSQAVVKIKGLADLMASNGEQAVKDRLELMDLSRSVLRMLVLDAENEDFERKPTPMTGLPDLIDRWFYRMSSAVGMPVSLLFGMSPGGLNATGENDVRNFYDAIKAFQEDQLRPQLEKLLKIMLCAKEGATGGVEPEGWSFEYLPLWEMSDKDKAALRKTVAETDQIYLNAMVISPEEVAQSRWGGDGYSLEMVVDEEAREVMRQAEEEQAELDREVALAAAKAGPGGAAKKPFPGK